MRDPGADSGRGSAEYDESAGKRIRAETANMTLNVELREAGDSQCFTAVRRIRDCLRIVCTVGRSGASVSRSCSR